MSRNLYKIFWKILIFQFQFIHKIVVRFMAPNAIADLPKADTWTVSLPFRNVCATKGKYMVGITGASLFIFSLLWKCSRQRILTLPRFGLIRWAFAAVCFPCGGNGNNATKGLSSGEKSLKPSLKRKVESSLAGRGRGIQGSQNSCYLDAFLFSIFYSTKAFENILEAKQGDTKKTKQTRKILNEEIFQSLRNSLFCSAQQTMKLRTLLRKYNPKIMGSFQAVEDVVYLLFENVLKEPKFIRYEDDVSAYMHVMLADTSSPSRVVQTQQCFESSMLLNGLKFEAVPSPAFILSLPWHKNRLFHYEAIVPSMTLNIDGFMTSKKCDQCEKNAVWESLPHPPGKSEKQNYFCENCVEDADPNIKYVSRTEMKLTSVMCFRSVHFTAFVRDCISESGEESWLHFDSMVAGSCDVKDVTLPLMKAHENWRDSVLSNAYLPANVQSFFCDPHTCIYEPIFYAKELSCQTKPKKAKLNFLVDWAKSKVPK